MYRPILVALALSPVASVTTMSAREPSRELTPAEIARSRELLDLSKESSALFAEWEQAERTGGETMHDTEKERRLRTLFARYDQLLLQNHEDLETLLLYGKLLRASGFRQAAYKLFSRADILSPGLAVTKHQLGAHLAEDGEFAAALPLLRQAVALAPAEARYHYDFAEFLTAAAKALAEKKALTRDECDRLLLEQFAEAAKLLPTEPAYSRRAAEAFHEVANPDPAKALSAWENPAILPQNDRDKEIISLHRAHWLLRLNRFPEARALVKSSTASALEATRNRLLEEISLREAAGVKAKE